MMNTRKQDLLHTSCACALNINVWQILQATDKLNKGRWREEGIS
jgi:hypothetical protein